MDEVRAAAAARGLTGDKDDIFLGLPGDNDDDDDDDNDESDGTSAQCPCPP